MKNPFDTPERTAFRESIAKYVQNEIKPHVNEWDEAGEIPWRIHEELGALGFYGFGIDEKYGGLGFDDAFMRKDATVELVKCGAGGVGAAVGGRNISTAPIQALATDEIKERCLPEIIAGRKGSSLCITEPGGGSDVANLQTKAWKDGNHWVIKGSKTFITGAMKSDYFVVAARTGGEGLGGVSLFFVEADTEGFSRTPLDRKMGWWCSDQATLYFDDCRVPAENLMGVENQGFAAIMNNFNLERVGLIAKALGMMHAVFDECRAYARERKTFGKYLAEHQVIRHKMADMSAKIDATEAYLNWICWSVNEDVMPVAEISKAKFYSTKALEFVCSEAMQIFGGAGYLRGNVVERMYREVKVIAIGGGSEEIMRDLAARQMGI